MVLGVDVGATKTAYVLWSGQKIKKYIKLETSLQNLKKIFYEYRSFKIGVGLPGAIDYQKAKINCPNIRIFDNINLRKLFPKGTLFDNDVNCFLRAEARLGAGKGGNNIIGLTFGTGIGGGIMVNGKLYQGKNGAAAEFGHIILDHGRSWEKIYQTTKNQPVKQKQYNSQGLASVINIFNPEAIIIGGGARVNYNSKIIKRLIMVPMPKIKKARLGEKAGAIGAALMVA